jgi:hypothetical protein
MKKKFNRGDKVRFVTSYSQYGVRAGNIVEVVSDDMEYVAGPDDYLVRVCRKGETFRVFSYRLEPVLGPLLSVEELLG